MLAIKNTNRQNGKKKIKQSYKRGALEDNLKLEILTTESGDQKPRGNSKQ